MSPVKIALGAFVIAAAGLLAYLAGSALRPEGSRPMTELPAAADRPVPGQLTEAATRQLLPDVTFTDAEGRERKLSDFRGKPVLVNFWATWCPPCVAEMPSLDALQAKLGTDTFTLLALSQDRDRKAADGTAVPGVMVAKKWLDEAKLANIPAYHAEQSVARALGTQSQLPVSILIDKQGREVARVYGAMHWDTPDVVARIAALAKE